MYYFIFVNMQQFVQRSSEDMPGQDATQNTHTELTVILLFMH